MRLYGLQQSRKKYGHVRRVSDANAEPFDPAVHQEEAAKDEEYKLIYHQTYRGAVFAFRRVIATELLYTMPSTLQETVDRLLGIFCSDPMAPT